MTDIHFESKVCKIQTHTAHLLKDAEKEAMQALLMTDQQAATPNNNSNSKGDEFDDALHEAITDHNKEETYHTCDFIVVSVTEVERLWSLCK